MVGRYTFEIFFCGLPECRNSVPVLHLPRLSTGCAQVADNILCLTVSEGTSYSVFPKEIQLWAKSKFNHIVKPFSDI
jgi:hypothetical protein